MSAAAVRFIVGSAASRISDPRPALPSKMKGPASFLGVMGPSTPDKASPTEADSPLGLGVRVEVRSMCDPGCSRREDVVLAMPGTGFLEIISTGATVALKVCWVGESESEGGGDSSFIWRLLKFSRFLRSLISTLESSLASATSISLFPSRSG